MGNSDILSILFNKINEDNLYHFDDSEKDELDSEITILDKRIDKFIKQNLYSKKQKKLNNLLEKYELSLGSFHHKECEMYFRTGVSLGIEFILEALSMKM